MLAVLSNLNYKPWFALAEFVDNAIQSMLDNREQLRRADGPDYKLQVDIEIDPADGGHIAVRDNAAGIALADFPRAFRPAAMPPDRTGLSEFGMGMKSASCWFAKKWSVRTSSLGDPAEYSIRFDVDKIVRDQIEELDIAEVKSTKGAHFTEVLLTDPYRLPVRRTLGKVKQHLTDIYRALIRDGSIEIRFNGELLRYEAPKVLVAPYFKGPKSDAKTWEKQISLDLGKGRSVTGYAALRDTGSTSNAGFSLFRRGRVIEGSGDEGYRPAAIFGAGNSYRSQRLFGEFHLEGFGVSHTKDGFQWDDYEDEFLEILKSELDDDALPLLRQAEGFRKIERTREHAQAIEVAVSNTSSAVESNLPGVIPVVSQLADDDDAQLSTKRKSPSQREVEFELHDQKWRILIDILDEPSKDAWFTRSIDTDAKSVIKVRLRLNSAHPFVLKFGQRDSESLEAILRLAVSVAVAETLARQAGVKMAGVVPRNINEVLTGALSES